jgi:hypothetical protein
MTDAEFNTKMAARWFLDQARVAFEAKDSPTRGDASASLKAVVNQVRFGVDAAENMAKEALELPSWRHDGAPSWEESIKTLDLL